MPNNQLDGMLEDFVAFLIPEGDLLWPYAQECVEAIALEDRPFGSHLAKAKIHTWLAWQNEPGRPLGSAIQQHYLESNAAHALVFVNWIRRLFDC